MSDKWNGWRRSDKDYALHIGMIPGRKQIAIYALTKGGSVLEPLGYFRSEEAAVKALEILNELMGDKS
jgi:hypothetical protein